MNAKMMEAGAKMMATSAAKAGGAGMAAAPAAKAGSAGMAAAAPAAKAGGVASASGLTAGKLLAATKAAVVTPMFGVVAIGSIIAFEWWKGSRDARKFSSAE
ncbi:MAG: hypothetical protein WBM35_14790 [Candidatus Electrothrix sp.]